MCLTFANYVRVLQVKMAYIDRKLALQQGDLFLNVTGFLRQTNVSQKVGPGGQKSTFYITFGYNNNNKHYLYTH